MTSAIDRFMSKVSRSDDCWQWTGAVSTNGYGRFYFQGRVWQAHRWIMSHTADEVPVGMDVDHLCRNRLRVRPDHLEVVSHSENMLRAPYMVGRSSSPTCRHGHDDWEPAWHNGREYRQCRTCDRERKRERRRVA